MLLTISFSVFHLFICYSPLCGIFSLHQSNGICAILDLMKVSAQQLPLLMGLTTFSHVLTFSSEIDCT